MSRRVVITGLGVVSPVGNSVAALWDALVHGRSGVGPLESLPADSCPVKVAGEAREFRGQMEDFGPLDAERKKSIRKALKVMCREIQMGVAAAQQALTHSGYTPGSWDPDRVGVIFGSDYILTMPDEFCEGVGECLNGDKVFDFSQWAERGLPKVAPLWLLKYLPNMPACHVAIYNDFRGPNNSITMREASSNLALAEACRTILRGSADVVVAGATGSRVHPLRTVHTLLQEEVAAGPTFGQHVPRPFDRQRNGMVIGEGAAAMVLESLQHAQRRGANILAEPVGFGSSMVRPSGGPPRRDLAIENVMRQALRQAEWTVDQVGHLHAHGLGTVSCDREEAVAIQRVFAARRSPVPVTAAKSYFGNLGAASGMVELIASLQAMLDGQLFPVLNFKLPDPECPVDVVRSGDVPAGSSVLSVNVTPQAQASAVLVRRI